MGGRCETKKKHKGNRYTNIYNCMLSSVMFLTETLDAPRDVNLLYHVYQEKFSNLFKKQFLGNQFLENQFSENRVRKNIFGNPVFWKTSFWKTSF